MVPTTPGTVPLRFLCHALSSSSSTHSLAIPLSLTEGLSEATHISKDARASKWDAALLSRKQSHLLSLTLCCPAGSALQSTEDGTEITIMQCQRSQFLSRSYIGTPSAESLTQTHRQHHTSAPDRTQAKDMHTNTWTPTLYRTCSLFFLFFSYTYYCRCFAVCVSPAGFPQAADWEK